ncbi:LpqB family beta-propeller domain-containing protein [Nocardioides convexus]|uniref:LpqB family beta-propeller domain-containing protein n=1 Tax=Nocardioides convexus TaxID=2712224 RepID=UPI0024185E6C|nr:LpqB family beta-propeller domain-containing protein [Nocardioides convexus]
MLDRRRGGARVWLVEGDQVRQVVVPGVSGRAARSLIVSRDGTRLVGVVRTAGGDEVRGARVLVNGRGRVAGIRAPGLVRAAQGTQIDDLAWTTPIRVGLLTTTAPGVLYEVDVVAADGASVGVDVISTIVSGRLVGLAAAPAEGSAMLAVYGDRYVNMVDQHEYPTGATPLTQTRLRRLSHFPARFVHRSGHGPWRGPPGLVEWAHGRLPRPRRRVRRPGPRRRLRRLRPAWARAVPVLRRPAARRGRAAVALADTGGPGAAVRRGGLRRPPACPRARPQGAPGAHPRPPARRPAGGLRGRGPGRTRPAPRARPRALATAGGAAARARPHPRDDPRGRARARR